MIDVSWLRAQAEAARCRAEVLDTSMRAARVRLMARAHSTDRALHQTANRRQDGAAPPNREDDARGWTSWIARRADGR
jgi:hypothetical protein